MTTPSTYIQAHQAELISSVQKLISFQTINPPGADYDAVTRHLENSLAERGLTTRRLVPSKKLQAATQPDYLKYPRSNVLGLWRVPGARKTLHFNAHYDVVPVGGQWKHGSPFSGTVSNGWIFGRGTADMKGSIAALFLALESLRATRTTPRLNVEVSFTADE